MKNTFALIRLIGGCLLAVLSALGIGVRYYDPTNQLRDKVKPLPSVVDELRTVARATKAPSVSTTPKGN